MKTKIKIKKQSVMAKKLYVGMTGRVYGYSYDSGENFDGDRCAIDEIFVREGLIKVSSDDENWIAEFGASQFVPDANQKPKSKQKPRKLWLTRTCVDNGVLVAYDDRNKCADHASRDGSDVVEFREVL